MTVETKFKPGDVVWFMDKDHAVSAKVLSVKVTAYAKDKYAIFRIGEASCSAYCEQYIAGYLNRTLGEVFNYPEQGAGNVFATKADLLASL